MSALDHELGRIVAERIAEALAQLERRLPAIIADAVRQAAAPAIIGTNELAALLGCRSKDPDSAARSQLRRDPELRALAFVGGGHVPLRWRRAEVEALLARREAEQRGRRK